MTLPQMAIKECKIDGIHYFIKGIVIHYIFESDEFVFIPQETFQLENIFIPLSFLVIEIGGHNLLDSYGENTRCLCCSRNDLNWVKWEESDFEFINNFTLKDILWQLEKELELI